MVHLLLAIIYLSFISLGLPDALLGAAWPIMSQELAAPLSYAGAVALIISDYHDAIGRAICEKLDRGVTVLNGHGYYSGQDKQVLLSAIKKRQAAELKQLVMDVDPNAFIILQEAHQVLGDGFKRYSKHDL